MRRLPLNLQGITIDDETDTAIIRLLGSHKYSISNNGKEFSFEGFEDDVPAFIRIPIEMGLNNLTVEGEKACQGMISEQVYFGELLAYPIPTMDYLRLEGPATKHTPEAPAI